MQQATTHTTRTAPTPIWTRFVAALALMLFCLVRTAAISHSHAHPYEAQHHKAQHHKAQHHKAQHHEHDSDAPHHSDNEPEETCSLCDLLAHSPLESPSILVFEASTVSLFAIIALPKTTAPLSRTPRSLADRAPPAFPALA